MRIKIDRQKNSEGMRIAHAQILTGNPPIIAIHASEIAPDADEAARLAALAAVRVLAAQLDGSPAERAAAMGFFSIEIA